MLHAHHLGAEVDTRTHVRKIMSRAEHMKMLDLLIGAFGNFIYFKVYVISLCTDQQSVKN